MFASYSAIPAAIWIFLRRRTDLSADLKPLAVLFAGFIFLCGLTHIIQLTTLWWPVYETQGYVKLATAIVSVITAAAIFPLIPKAIAIPSPRQLQLVNSGLAREIAAHREAQAALRASEERFRGIFEHAGTGIAITDMEGRFQTCNPAYSAMMGYSEDELRKLNVADIQHPDDRDMSLEKLAQLVAEEIPSFEIVNRCLSKDGKPIWVHKYISLLRDAKGEPTNTIGLITDITEQKRQDDQIRLLMREVNHRSKNILALVQAIARQTLAANVEDFLDRFEKRVQALASSQDLLVKNDWKGANINDLARSQLGHFEDLIGTRIKLQGPPLFVSTSAAQTIGMALHELATNAGKYGALVDADGQVDIGWSLEGSEIGKETFIMSWREQCARPIAAPAKQGFGSRFVRNIAEMGLGGKVELDFPATGLIWTLECAASEVLENGIRPAPAVKNERTASNDAGPGWRPRILIVEDEALVAMDLVRLLAEAGFDIVGPARAVPAALELLERVGCDTAVLDLHLGSGTSEAIAVELMAMETPFVTLSGYSPEQYPSPFAGAPALRKPVQPEILISQLKRCLQHKDAWTPGGPHR
jgi:PAS domain S-box-containing protein